MRVLLLAIITFIPAGAVGQAGSPAFNPQLTNSIPNLAGGPILYYNGSGPVPPYDSISPNPPNLPALTYLSFLMQEG